MHLFQLKNKKLIVLILVLVAVAGLAISGTLAMYTSQAYQRSVVRNRDSSSALFSSDLLFLTQKDTSSYGNAYSMQGTGEEAFDIVFHIYNYDVSKTSLVNENDIKYDITFTLTTGDTCKVKANNEVKELSKGESYTISNETFQASRAEQKEYVITCQSKDLDTAMITVVAEPHSKYYYAVQNQKLAANIVPLKSQGGQVSVLNGEFTDQSRTDRPGDLAAWPYLVTITSGEENVTISWENSILQIDPFFIDKYAGHDTEYNGSVVKTIF